MKNLSPINENKDVVTKEYVDSKVAFYDGIVHRSTNTDTTNCWVKIAECEAPNSTVQIMDEITLYPNTTDSAVKTTCKVRVEGKGAYASTWKLHIIDSTKDFNSNKVKLIYDKNIVDDKRKIELWGYNINGWDGFYSQKTFGNKNTLTHGLKCLTSQDKFKTTYLHDDFVEAPTIDISIKSLVNEGLTSLENDIAVNRTTLGTQCKNLLKNTAVTKTVNGVTFTVNDDKSVTLNGTSTAQADFYLRGAWGSTSEILQKNKYIASIGVSQSSTFNGVVMHCINNTTSISSPSCNHPSLAVNSAITAVYISVSKGYTFSNYKLYPMIRCADILDDTYEPYKENVDERLIKNKSDIAVNKSTLGYQRKNLLKNNAVTQTVSGVTFTVNSDGSVTVNGTNTSSSSAYIQLCGLVNYGNSKLIASIGQNITDVYMAIYDSDWNWIGTGSAGTISWENSNKERLVRLVVKPRATINNVTVYPMLRYADITDDTYEPYKESVDERITNNVSDIAINKSTLGYQRKNILDETGYLSSITSVTRGTKSISGNQITLKATADNCFTNPHTSSDGGYRIPVEPDTDYILSWESDNTYAGLVYVFMNGNTSNYKNANNKVSKYIKFTTNSDTTFITIRLAVATSGNSITYSNIMLRYADITDDTYEPYQPSVIERCLLKDTAGIALGAAQSSSITIDNLSAYTALWVNVSGNVSGINFKTNLVVPVAYLAKNTSNSVQLAGGIPSSAYITSEGVLAVKHMDGTITAKISGNTLDLTIGTGTIGSIEVVSLM